MPLANGFRESDPGMPIGSLIGSFFTGAVQQGVTSAFAPGGIFGGGGFFPTGGGVSYTPTAASAPALPAPPSSSTAITITGQHPIVQAGQRFPRWLWRILVDYGPAVADAVWGEFQRRRRGGASTTEARRAVASAYPNLPGSYFYGRGGGRRRINPANVKALRRAVRRVRSFRKLSTKVRGVFPSRSSTWAPRRRRRRVYARGDLDPMYRAEDVADLYDEAEDLGFEPGPFREEDTEE